MATSPPTSVHRDADDRRMQLAIEAAWTSRLISPPNPWVGSVLVAIDSRVFIGSTRQPGGNHAEREVIDAAGPAAAGSTLYSTLEPCSHHGRTGPCVEAIIAAGVRRVVVGVVDPDPLVAGRGLASLIDAGLTVVQGVLNDRIESQLAPYLHHRRTGRPFVVLKLAATLDGRIAAADASSQWITSPEARADAHRLRAESGAILVGAATVRDDDPQLTVRGVERPDGKDVLQPLRVVLGTAPENARVHPCLEHDGPLVPLLDTLGRRGVLQLMVEGGATVAGAFHRERLVDRYVLYQAPAIMGGDDGRPLLAGPGAATIGDLFRGRIDSVQRIGPDLRIDLVPIDRPAAARGAS
ncbi:MAG: bifunctional diaminohydroxyphosphoribosylaminopyrimidine deaminase/5-amino-6-(5-phosphoribosylamino)uracil reductase RibD [Actinomycetota bacterium]|nr:bifunctional diaminohydroxyphosphoribosylaminopyrimidine deaminase/5-amino-6-(5-phosphoribosylamino)uracil reductase RibD [Actinomycetota bacterium]